MTDILETEAAKIAKPAKAPKAADKLSNGKVKKPKPAPQPKPVSARQQIIDAASAGVVPSPPDFSAATHARFRKRLAEITALVEAADIKKLRALTINPVSSSPKAMLKYRDLAIVALEAQRNAGRSGKAE